MTIVGLNFPTDQECEVTYSEATSSSCTVLSDGTVEANFPAGIPISQNGEEPILSFTLPPHSVPESMP